MQRGAEPAAGAAAGQVSSAYRISSGHRSVGRRRAGVGLKREDTALHGSLPGVERPHAHALRTAAAAVDHCSQAAPEELAYNEPPPGSWQAPASSEAGIARAGAELPGPQQSMLQLVAAWDQLAARLPPEAGMGAAAESILNALKLALAHTTAQQRLSVEAGGALPRALSLASRLADLSAEGLPLDADAIAAGILVDSLGTAGAEGVALVERRVGPAVAALLHDVGRVRALPSRVDLYDDAAASALRELCLNFYDVRSTAVEVVARLDGLAALSSPGSAVPRHAAQGAALEALQIFAPLGHALGMGRVASELEDRCFRLLFPASYARTAAWLREQTAANAGTLELCRARLSAALAAHPSLPDLAAGVEVHGRAKGLFSILKKQLRLGDTARGGRDRHQVYDLLGIRAVVLPRPDLAPEAAEARAQEAAYIVRAVAGDLWEAVGGRCKDYIAAPKPNGYQSLHSTLRVPSATVDVSLDSGEEWGEGAARAGGGDFSVSGGSWESSAEEEGGAGWASLELQIRTQAMHERAEKGEAAHAAYKGGLDATQAAQLKAWTDSLLQRAALAAAAAAAAAASSSEDEDGASAGSGDASEAAAAGLFRHLDRNGDGRLSVEELSTALGELGAAGDAAAQREAAAELLRMASASSSEDGTIGLAEFLTLQRAAGLPAAASAVDLATAGRLEQQAAEQAAEEEAEAVAQQQQEQGSSSLSPAAAAGPAVANAAGGSAMHAWGLGRQPESPSRPAPAAPKAVAQGGRVSSSGSSLDELIIEGSPASAPARRRATTASSSGSGRRSRHAGRIILEEMEAVPEDVAGASSSNGSSSSSSSSSTAMLEQQHAAAMVVGEPLPEKDVPSTSDAGPSSQQQRQQRQQPATPAVVSGVGEAQRAQRGEMAVHKVARLFADPPAADARWALQPAASNVAAPRLPGGAPAGAPAAVALPQHGATIVGGATDKDVDLLLEVPTVSGKHARLEVRRGVTRRGRPGGPHSQLVLTDLGSTNGTWVNSAAIQPWVEVSLRPGDVFVLAEAGVAFKVAVHEPAPQRAQQAAVSAAATLAGGLLAAAEARGCNAWGCDEFGEATPVATYADASQHARDLSAAGRHEDAWLWLLGAARRDPDSGGLWAQLANAERQRARLREPGSNFGAARIFYRAAAAAFEAAPSPAARCEGLLRVLGGWAQMEFHLGHTATARALYLQAHDAGRAHPTGGGASVARSLLDWARCERRQGDAGAAARLCGQALALAPTNAAALALAATAEAEAGRMAAARPLFERAAAAEPRRVSTLQAWGRAEAAAGDMDAARSLFDAALRLDPVNAYVLQAWAVAEQRAGCAGAARALLRRCTAADPACRAAWHAWALLEESEGDGGRARELFQVALRLKPDSVETLSALGHLERRDGNLDAAEAYLTAALAADSRHAPSTQELSLVREAQGEAADAERLRLKAWRLNKTRRVAARRAAAHPDHVPQPRDGANTD